MYGKQSWAAGEPHLEKNKKLCLLFATCFINDLPRACWFGSTARFLRLILNPCLSPRGVAFVRFASPPSLLQKYFSEQDGVGAPGASLRRKVNKKKSKKSGHFVRIHSKSIIIKLSRDDVQCLHSLVIDHALFLPTCTCYSYDDERMREGGQMKVNGEKR